MTIVHAVKTSALANKVVKAKLNSNLQQAMQKSWEKIPPLWPLKNFIAVNPLKGLEDLPFDVALAAAQRYFQQQDLPWQMQTINRITIKWLQVFCDTGQATITMPQRQLGFLPAIRQLIRFDKEICVCRASRQWLSDLPAAPQAIIAHCLLQLNIPTASHAEFMTLQLTALPGWAAYIQYLTSWAGAVENQLQHPITQAEYLAFRLMLVCLIWPAGKDLLSWHAAATAQAAPRPVLAQIVAAEKAYREPLLANIAANLAATVNKVDKLADAQLVFCIDVRSEPMRHAIEAAGNYETFGFAGFFGLPVQIENIVTKQSFSACPVLLQPVHTVLEKPAYMQERCKNGYGIIIKLQSLYQALKYNFTTPFVMVETLGLVSGMWMLGRTFAPTLAFKLKQKLGKKLQQHVPMRVDVSAIAFADQCAYAASVLKIMGLVENFAPLVVFCGHGSQVANNSFASALDCGACGGRHGGSNAQILADILNDPNVRTELKKEGLFIPEQTFFMAAEHNTTTDDIELYKHNVPAEFGMQMQKLQAALQQAKHHNNKWRSAAFTPKVPCSDTFTHTARRSHNWAEVRPEWGLAGNAAFIVGPRSLTRSLHLAGRAFLHSYDWTKDYSYDWASNNRAPLLTTILTAPMIVAQWINCQYLFSTVDNVAFGAGSKVTENITGKIGVMQGNASDLMHGLPLQSVFASDTVPYHQPVRLATIVYAPKFFLDSIIASSALLQQLFANQWLALYCIQPDTKQIYQLEASLQWSKI